MFKVKEETTDNFLILSVRDQERQLESRVQALEDMIDALHHGKNYFFERKFMGGVHAERAQIFWYVLWVQQQQLGLDIKRGAEPGGFEFALESATFWKNEDPFLTAFPKIRKKVYIE